ncbi:MAG: NAD(P)/FAD-dependent oxidoreductase, partial [Solirubrobacterales bacterium]
LGRAHTPPACPDNPPPTADRLGPLPRREGFRAHAATDREVTEAVDSGDVDLYVPYQVREVSGDGAIEKVTLFHSENDEEVEVETDAVLLQLGFKTALGPLKDWGFEVEKGAIKVSPTYETALERIWACGDITTFDGKLKLIATGYAEAATAVAQAVHMMRPDTRLQPKYSTNTGVPGAVEGQA